jgi:hypothetical protein
MVSVVGAMEERLEGREVLRCVRLSSIFMCILPTNLTVTNIF